MPIDATNSGDSIASISSIQQEVASGQRFAFGKNWLRFLSVLNEDRIAEAERSLREMLGEDALNGKTFLDVGSGSGLFSLAAMRLGATRVRSFDYDPQSVDCTRELKRRYFPNAAGWEIERGDVLDESFMQNLGAWDFVYSWGVLHHTGDMWQALENVSRLVQPSGAIFISIYNDQGGASRRWRTVKKLYNRGDIERRLIAGAFIPYSVLRGAAIDVLRRKNPVQRYRDYKKSRGMSRIHDWLDWLGGYPYEVAKPDEIFAFFQQRGFTLERLTTRGGWGCNEFVFRRP